MCIVRVRRLQRFEDGRVEISIVSKFRLVQFLVQAGLDLAFRERLCSGKDNVIAASAGEQLGLHDFVGVINVVGNLDAGGGLKVFQGIRCYIVRPVVDVYNLVIGQG